MLRDGPRSGVTLWSAPEGKDVKLVQRGMMGWFGLVLGAIVLGGLHLEDVVHFVPGFRIFRRTSVGSHVSRVFSSRAPEIASQLDFTALRYHSRMVLHS